VVWCGALNAHVWHRISELCALCSAGVCVCVCFKMWNYCSWQLGLSAMFTFSLDTALKVSFQFSFMSFSIEDSVLIFLHRWHTVVLNM